MAGILLRAELDIHSLGLHCQGCASNPNDSDQQQILRSAAEELRSATNAAASNQLKRKLINRLEVSDCLDNYHHNIT